VTIYRQVPRVRPISLIASIFNQTPRLLYLFCPTIPTDLPLLRPNFFFKSHPDRYPVFSLHFPFSLQSLIRTNYTPLPELPPFYSKILPTPFRPHRRLDFASVPTTLISTPCSILTSPQISDHRHHVPSPRPNLSHL
jgi:hypothetical protein